MDTGVRAEIEGRRARIMAAPPPADLKEIADKLTKAFEDYKVANDERLGEIEKLGSETPELSEKMAKADKAIEELKAQMATAQAAHQKRVDDLELQIGRSGLNAGAEGANDLAVRAAAFFTVRNALNDVRRRMRPGDQDLDIEGYLNYCTNFELLVRKQCNSDALSSDIRNALSVGSDPDGGWLVPTEMSMEIERRIFDTSPMRQICRVISIGAPAWEAPYKSTKAISGGWVGERQARPATETSRIGMQRIETHEQYAYPEVTQAMLDDAAMDVEDFLVTDTEEEMSRTENLAFVSGDGVLKPRGFLDYAATSVTTDDATRDWGVLQHVPSGAAGGFPSAGADNPDALITLISKLHPTYRGDARWTMNRQVEAAVRKLKDADGRYLVGFGDLRDNVTGFNVLGFPITNLEDMPNLASDSFSIAFGNFRRGYYILDRIGFRVLRDPYTNKPYVGFYITKRTGGDLRNFDAVKLMKFAAG